MSLYSLFSTPSNVISGIWQFCTFCHTEQPSCNLSVILLAPMDHHQMLIVEYGSSELSVLTGKFNQVVLTGKFNQEVLTAKFNQEVLTAKFNQEVLTAKFNQEKSQSFLYSSLWLTIKC